MRAPVLLSLLLAVATSHASELHVAAGQHYTIEHAELALERLRLEDGAVLRVKPGLSTVKLTAAQAWIGDDVRILANGADASAVAEVSVVPAAGACMTPVAGAAGHDGLSGGEGVHLELALGLHRFGSLLLDARGGAGSAGGNGANGAAGSSDPRCAGTDGANGGDGGAGGAGGAGGNVLLRYWSVSQTGHVPVSNYGPGVQILTAGGAGAAPGQPGSGGLGGVGERVKRPTGVIVQRSSGSDGQPGVAGVWGKPGAAGTFLIQPQSAPAR